MPKRCPFKSLLLWCALVLMPITGLAAGKCERLVATGNPEYPLTCGATRRTRSS